MEKIVIVGGGVAGLSCLNALVDKGISALLLEGTTIGTPKMCGEFLAPPTIPLLDQWEIGPVQSINQAYFHAKNKEFNLNFLKPAGAMARSEVELQLAKRARRSGGCIQENCMLKEVIPATVNSVYKIILSSGAEIQSEQVVFATGKFLPKVESRHERSEGSKLTYKAIKTHIPLVIQPNTLLMYSIPQAYFGFVPISDQQSNFACLLKSNLLNSETIQNFFKKIIKENKFLSNLLSSVDLNTINLLEGQTFGFSMKSIPDWPNAYWIGDALASIPPAIGYGFAHSIQSGILAAEAYCSQQSKKYKTHSTQLVKPKLRIGQFMHQVLLNPRLGSWMFPMLQAYPQLPNWVLKRIAWL